jgi:hypothetical protein
MSTNVGLIDRIARIALGLLLRSRVRAAFCPTAGTESDGSASSRSLRRSEASRPRLFLRSLTKRRCAELGRMRPLMRHTFSWCTLSS